MFLFMPVSWKFYCLPYCSQMCTQQEGFTMVSHPVYDDTVCILNNAATTLVTWLHLVIWLYSSCIDSGKFLACSDSSQFLSPVYKCCIWSCHITLTPLFSLTLPSAVELKDAATLCAAQVPCHINQRMWGAVIKLQTDMSTDCTIFVHAVFAADSKLKGEQKISVRSQIF